MLGRPSVSQHASPLARSQTIVRLLMHLYPLSNSFIAFKAGAGLCGRLFNSRQVSGGSREGAGGASLFLDQTEARRAENNFFGDQLTPAPPPPPPPYLRLWMTAPFLSEGLEPPRQVIGL